MNRKKIVSTLAAFSLITGTSMSSLMTMTINAADTTYATKGGTASFASYLIMDANTIPPDTSIKYSITPYDAATVTNTSNTAKNATVTDAVFTHTSKTYNKVQTMDPTLIENKIDSTTNTTLYDSLTLQSDQIYSRAIVTVDFSNVTFDDMGKYYFLITESSDQNSDAAIKYDDTAYVMEVYATYDTNADGTQHSTTLQFGNYIMYKATKVVATDNTVSYTINDGTGTTQDTKGAGFVNEFTTKSLTISKAVSGNQASHDEYFQFDVDIIGPQAGAIYQVDITGADKTTTINGYSKEAHTNETTMEAGYDYNDTEIDNKKEAKQRFWLHTGQQVVINNIPIGSSYTVTEEPTKAKAEGYTTTAVITGDTINGLTIPTTKEQVDLLSSGTFEYKSASYVNAEGTTSYDHSVITFTTTGTSHTGTLVYTTVTGVKESDPTKSSEFTWTEPSLNVIEIVMNNTTYDFNLNTATNTLTPKDSQSTLIFTKVSGTDVKYDKGDNPDSASAAALNPNTLTFADSYITEDTTVAYTNEKHGTVPTGIIMNTAPYAIVVLAGFCGLVFFIKKKKEAEEE